MPVEKLRGVVLGIAIGERRLQPGAQKAVCDVSVQEWLLSIAFDFGWLLFYNHCWKKFCLQFPAGFGCLVALRIAGEVSLNDFGESRYLSTEKPFRRQASTSQRLSI